MPSKPLTATLLFSLLLADATAQQAPRHHRREGPLCRQRTGHRQSSASRRLATTIPACASQSGAGSTYALQTGQNIQSQADAQRANTAVMADLADSAGGTFIHNTNDLEGGFKTLLAAPECTYLLELSLQDVKQNGAYRSLKLEVSQPGLKVQARKGYFAPQATKQ